MDSVTALVHVHIKICEVLDGGESRDRIPFGISAEGEGEGFEIRVFNDRFDNMIGKAYMRVEPAVYSTISNDSAKIFFGSGLLHDGLQMFQLQKEFLEIAP